MGKLDFFFVDTKANISHTFEDGALEGETIFVREMITYGEQLDIRSAALVGITDDEGRQIFVVDAKKREMAEMKTWLLTWSLESRDGQQKRIVASKIEGLHPRAAAQIGRFVTKYSREKTGDTEETVEVEKATEAPAGSEPASEEIPDSSEE